jgi:hypothetical protein
MFFPFHATSPETVNDKLSNYECKQATFEEFMNA